MTAPPSTTRSPWSADAGSSRTERRGARLLAAVLVGWCALAFAAHLWATAVSLDLASRPGALALAVSVAAAFWLFAIKRPLGASLLLLGAIPLFGNHPGGRLMEVFNLPLAASAAGLALLAARDRRPVPRGAVVFAAGVYLLSALLAVIPVIADVMVRMSQLNDWSTITMTALTAPEVDPLYSLSTAAGLTLCIAWAVALIWASPGRAFFTAAVRVIVYVFFVVVALGALDYHGVIAIAPSYLLAIDPRRPDVSGFQSIFWNPGWFAWYFVMVFGLALGWLWTARGRERTLIAVLLAISYVYFFTNPQRGGFVALHVCLFAAAAVPFFSRHRPRQARRVLAAAALVLAVGITAAYALEVIPQSLGSSLFRLLASPEETQTSNSVRARLWTVAVRMWRDAPVLGLGESSFAWRFEDYAPRGSALYTEIHGDAHNTWLQILATRGLLGVVTLAVLLAVTAAALLRAWRHGSADRGLVAGIALSLIGFTIYSSVQGMFYLQSIHALFWFLIAAAAIAAPATTAVATRRTVIAVAATALAGVAFQAVSSASGYNEAAALVSRLPPGFYGVERDPASPSWRWSAGDATLCLQPAGPTVTLQMAVGDPRPATYPRRVTLMIDERVVDTVEVLNGGVFSRNLRLPAVPPAPRQPVDFGECTGADSDIRLTIDVDRTWSPMSAGVGTDSRTLGVQVFEPVYAAPELTAPAVGNTAPAGPAIR